MSVYQSNEMQRLQRRYASILVFLEATCQATKYALPCYLVIQTNVNYQVAAVAATEMITEALSQINSFVIS